MFLRKCKNALNLFGVLAALTSFTNNLNAAECDGSLTGNYLGIGGNYTMKTMQYNLDTNYSMSGIIDKIQSPVMNNNGYGASISYTRFMDNDFFLEGALEYKKQNNFMLVDRSLPSEIVHRSFGVGLNGGYSYDLGCNIRPFASLGIGVANFNTKLKFYYRGRDLRDIYLTNFHTGVNEIRPSFNYKLGIQFLLEKAIVETGYQYLVAQDLSKYLNAQGLGLVTEDGKQSPCFGLKAFKNRFHNAFVSVKILL